MCYLVCFSPSDASDPIIFFHGLGQVKRTRLTDRKQPEINDCLVVIGKHRTIKRWHVLCVLLENLHFRRPLASTDQRTVQAAVRQPGKSPTWVQSSQNQTSEYRRGAMQIPCVPCLGVLMVVCYHAAMVFDNCRSADNSGDPA